MRGKIFLLMVSMLVLSGLLVGISCTKPAPTPPSPPVSPSVVPSPTTLTPVPAPKPVPAPTPTPTFQPKLPSKLVMASLDVGTSGYSLAVTAAQALNKAYGMTVRVIPAGTGVSRTMAVSSGAADIGFMGYEAWCLGEGIEEFATFEWGPQKVVALSMPPWAVGPVARADSGIKTPADLKGKKAAFIPGLASVNEKTRAVLAFAGYTMDDAVLVTFPSAAAGYQALIDGKADWFSTGGPAAAKLYELAASPRGLYWIPVPRADKEGWKRVQAVTPLVPTLIKEGAGLKKGETIEALGMHFPIGLTFEGRMPEEVAYALVKAIDEVYEKYIRGTIAGTEVFIFKEALDPPFDVPIHPGAIRYAKEKGLWTAEREAANKAAYDRMAKAQKAWETVVAEATDKGLKEADFPKYWLKRKAELAGK